MGHQKNVHHCSLAKKLETELKNLKIKNSSSIKKQFQLGTETVGTGTVGTGTEKQFQVQFQVGTGTEKQFQNSSIRSDSSDWYDHPRLQCTKSKF